MGSIGVLVRASVSLPALRARLNSTMEPVPAPRPRSQFFMRIHRGTSSILSCNLFHACMTLKYSFRGPVGRDLLVPTGNDAKIRADWSLQSIPHACRISEVDVVKLKRLPLCSYGHMICQFRSTISIYISQPIHVGYCVVIDREDDAAPWLQSEAGECTGRLPSESGQSAANYRAAAFDDFDPESPHKGNGVMFEEKRFNLPPLPPPSLARFSQCSLYVVLALVLGPNFHKVNWHIALSGIQHPPLMPSDWVLV